MLTTSFRTKRPSCDQPTNWQIALEQPTKAKAKRVVQSVDLLAGTCHLICEQNCNCINDYVYEYVMEIANYFLVSVLSLQAPASGVDIFGSTTGPGLAGPMADPPPTAATTSHNLQDLMGFSDHSRYCAIHTESPLHLL